MNKALVILSAAASAVVLSSCMSTSIDAQASAVEGADFSRYKTYAWVPLDREAANSFTDRDRAVRKAFIDQADSILSSRGYELAESGTPDLYFYARGLRKPGFRSVGTTPSYETRFIPSERDAAWLGETSAGSGMGQGYLRSETQIGVRFLASEPKTDKAVWRGSGRVRVDDSRNDALVQNDARRLAVKFLKGFPRASR